MYQVSMGPTAKPIVKNIVLVGGGHSHAIVLRKLSMHSLPGLRVILVSEVSHTPYSGMLPGLIAGDYSLDESHIDLRRLVRAAGAEFVLAKVTGVDTKHRRVLLEGRPPLQYDILSLNTGITPMLSEVPGAAEFAVPVKPVPTLLSALDSFFSEGRTKISLAIVGGGAGGVELAMAFDAKLSRFAVSYSITLFNKHSEILAEHTARARRLLNAELARRNIKVLSNCGVTEVREGLLLTETEEFSADLIVWATHAQAPPWFTETGLTLNENGFIRVNANLQSISHPEVFAVGDCAHVDLAPRPKSGVFAVRQGAPLFKNLLALASGSPLQEYHPQKAFLSLISSSRGTAVASRGSFSAHGRLFWALKQYIDRAFMKSFSELSPMSESSEPKPEESTIAGYAELFRASQQRCLGCGAKVAASVLSKAFNRLREESSGPRSKVLGEFSNLDDAAYLPVHGGQGYFQTVDYFPAILSDPYLFGRISLNHAMSDIFAMGAQPHSVLSIAVLPYSAEDKSVELLYQLLAGAVEELSKMDAVLLGGHAAEGPQFSAGFVCNGIEGRRRLEKRGLSVGDRLLLTKPLGVGVLFAGEMYGKSKGSWIDTAVESMLLSNYEASRIASNHGASACTDVTGFGLLGHLLEMCLASSCGAELAIEDIPVLPGALELLSRGIASSLQVSNLQNVHGRLTFESTEIGDPRAAVLCDPQTSGGLLISIAEDGYRSCLDSLENAGFQVACIGRVIQERSIVLKGNGSA